jgi:hypothetical protein
MPYRHVGTANGSRLGCVYEAFAERAAHSPRAAPGWNNLRLLPLTCRGDAVLGAASAFARGELSVEDRVVALVARACDRDACDHEDQREGCGGSKSCVEPLEA